MPTEYGTCNVCGEPIRQVIETSVLRTAIRDLSISAAALQVNVPIRLIWVGTVCGQRRPAAAKPKVWGSRTSHRIR
jgi:hypothetical protein